MPRFKVHVYAVCHAAIDVEAETPEAAIAKARDDTDWSCVLRCGTDFADDFEGYLVDPYGEDGEPDTERSEFFADEHHVSRVLQGIQDGVKQA